MECGIWRCITKLSDIGKAYYVGEPVVSISYLSIFKKSFANSKKQICP